MTPSRNLRPRQKRTYSSGSWVHVGETAQISNAVGPSSNRSHIRRSVSSTPLRDTGAASTRWNERKPIPLSDIVPSDIVILILGITGSGMSNFINKLTGVEEERESRQLVSCTKDVKAYACVRGRQRFIFVDTPGFNATYMSQRAVFTKTAEWLQSTYLTGVIYMHRITDTYESGTAYQSFRIFSGMCGEKAADRVRLVTTMWDEEYEQPRSLQMESRLKTEWGSLLNAGASYERFYNTADSAWQIVNGLGYQRKALLLQREIVDMGKKMEETTAGMRVPREERKPTGFFDLVKRLFGF
ncbi:hypothetical protein V8B97DRAFT_409681 [Scleroderma yunnanense]